MRKAIIFDLGNTLIVQQIDNQTTLDNMTLVPVQGAEIVLRELHKHYKLALLSNTEQSGKPHLSGAIVKLGWGELFDVLASSIDIGARKPAKFAFQHVLDALGVSSDEAIMIGNDLEVDIDGASRSGLGTIFYSCDESDWRALRNGTIRPDHVVMHLKDLVPLLVPNQFSKGI